MRRARWAIALAAAGGAAWAGCWSAPAGPPMHRARLSMQRGLEQQREGRNPHDAYRAAISAADERLESVPDDRDALRLRAGAWRNIGVWLVRRGRDPSGAYKRSGLTLRALLAIDPHDATAWQQLAQLKVNHGLWVAGHGGDARPLYRDAIEVYDRLITRAPGNTELRRDRGRALLDFALARAAAGEPALPELHQSLRDLNRAVDAGLADAGTMRTRAGVRLNLANGEPAMRRAHLQYGMADVNKAAALAPGDAYVFVTRAQLGQALARHDFEDDRDPRAAYTRALADITRALELDPERDPNDWKLLADTHFLAAQAEASLGGDPKPGLRRALDAYERTVKVAPKLAAAVREQMEFCRTQLGR